MSIEELEKEITRLERICIYVIVANDYDAKARADALEPIYYSIYCKRCELAGAKRREAANNV